MSMFDVGDKVVSALGYGFGTVLGTSDISGLVLVTWDTGTTHSHHPSNLTLHNLVSPLTEEQIEFLRNLWWNEPAGTDAERILGELLKWRV